MPVVCTNINLNNSTKPPFFTHSLHSDVSFSSQGKFVSSGTLQKGVIQCRKGIFLFVN